MSEVERVIDASVGPIGVTRLLTASPGSATSWQWRLVRAPADSVATLSSSTVRDPTFTPDMRGLYVFRPVASQDGVTSVTTASLRAAVRFRGVRRP